MQLASVPTPVVTPPAKVNGKVVPFPLRVLSRFSMPKREKPQSKLDAFVDKGVEQLSYPRAIYLQTVFTIGYVIANVVTFKHMLHFDPYPFLFLNLLYSLASGYATVFVLNSQRRQDAEARRRQDELRLEIRQVLEENRAQSRVIKKLLNEYDERGAHDQQIK